MSTQTGNNYGAKVNVTITVGALANGSAWGGLAINSSAQKQLDAAFFINFTTNATTVAAPFGVSVYIATSIDGVTGPPSTYDDLATGTDAAQTLTVPPNALKLMTVNCPVANKAYQRGMSLRSIFPNGLPAWWQPIIVNNSGGSLTTGLTAWYAYSNLITQ